MGMWIFFTAEVAESAEGWVKKGLASDWTDGTDGLRAGTMGGTVGFYGGPWERGTDS